MKRTKEFLTIVVIACSFFVISCSSGESEVYEVDGVYTFSLTGLNGENMSISDLRGKGVMLNAWATWCAPCIEEMPILVRLYDKYKNKGLEIWGVSTDIEGKSVVEPVVQKMGINYPILLAKSSDLTQILGVPFRGLPITIFFKPDGSINYTHFGSVDAYIDEEAGESVESWFEGQIMQILPESE